MHGPQPQWHRGNRWAAIVPLLLLLGPALTGVLAQGDTSTPRFETELAAPNTSPGDRFGAAVDIQAETAVVGAPGTEGPLGTRQDVGAGYVYTRATPGVWAPGAHLSAPTPTEGERFGADVAVHDQTVAVGAPGHDGATEDSGAVYIFEQAGATWAPIQRLEPPSSTASGDGFGAAVAFEDGHLIVGAPGHAEHAGAAYLYEQDTSRTFALAATLTPAGTERGDRFGADLAVDGGVLAAGAPGYDDPHPDAGAAYRIATLDGSETRLAAPGSFDGMGLGSAVAVDGARTMLGGPSSEVVYADDGDGTVTELGSFRDGAFGAAIALGSDLAIVGAPQEDGEVRLDVGATYVYEADGWTLQARLSQPDAGSYERFGASVAIDAGTVLVGAPAGAASGKPGAAYVYS